MSDFLKDLSLARRQFFRRPLFTATVVATLAIGIALNTVMMRDGIVLVGAGSVLAAVHGSGLRGVAAGAKGRAGGPAGRPPPGVRHGSWGAFSAFGRNRAF